MAFERCEFCGDLWHTKLGHKCRVNKATVIEADGPRCAGFDELANAMDAIIGPVTPATPEDVQDCPERQGSGQRVVKAEVGPDGSVIASEDVRPGDLVVVERVRRFSDIVATANRRYERPEEPWYGSNPLRMITDPVLYHLFEPRPAGTPRPITFDSLSASVRYKVLQPQSFTLTSLDATDER